MVQTLVNTLHLFTKKKICSVGIKGGQGRVRERVGEVKGGGGGAQKGCGWEGKFVCHSF